MEYVNYNCFRVFSFLFVKKPINSTTVVSVANKAEQLSSSAEELIPEDIGNIATVLEKIVDVKGKSDEVKRNFNINNDNVR